MLKMPDSRSAGCLCGAWSNSPHAKLSNSIDHDLAVSVPTGREGNSLGSGRIRARMASCCCRHACSVEPAHGAGHAEIPDGVGGMIGRAFDRSSGLSGSRCNIGVVSIAAVQVSNRNSPPERSRSRIWDQPLMAPSLATRRLSPGMNVARWFCSNTALSCLRRAAGGHTSSHRADQRDQEVNKVCQNRLQNFGLDIRLNIGAGERESNPRHQLGRYPH